MPWLFNIVLAGHVGAGLVALITFWGAVATRKGGAAHRRWGSIFAASIYAAGVLALAMGTLSLRWPLAMHPGLTDAALYRGLFGWMMLYLALLTISMTRYGLAMVANKRDHDANRHWSMVAWLRRLATIVSPYRVMLIVSSARYSIIQPNRPRYRSASVNLWCIANGQTSDSDPIASAPEPAA